MDQNWFARESASSGTKIMDCGICSQESWCCSFMHEHIGSCIVLGQIHSLPHSIPWVRRSAYCIFQVFFKLQRHREKQKEAAYICCMRHRQRKPTSVTWSTDPDTHQTHEAQTQKTYICCMTNLRRLSSGTLVWGKYTVPMGENTGAGLKNGMPSNPAAASPYTPSAPTGTEHKQTQSVSRKPLHLSGQNTNTQTHCTDAGRDHTHSQWKTDSW